MRLRTFFFLILIAGVSLSLISSRQIDEKWRSAKKKHTVFDDDSGADLQKKLQAALIDLRFAPAKVIVDDVGVPHIWSDDQRSLFAAQGFVHAYYRLWQMESWSRYAEGTASALASNKLDADDVFAQQADLLKSAVRSEKLMLQDPQTRDVLTAYSDGVNARIRQLTDQTIPVEFLYTESLPREWKPLHTALILTLSAWNLTTGEREIALTRTKEKLSKEKFQHLFPFDPIEPSLFSLDKTAARYPVKNMEFRSETASLAQLASSSGLDRMQPAAETGSNAWLLSGNMTTTGFPIVANDFHNRYLIPNSVMPLQLVTREFNSIGSSLVGTPALYTGMNGDVAWTFVNAMADTVDWYLLKFRDVSRREYWWNSRWTAVEETTRITKLRSGAENEIRMRKTKAGNLLTRQLLDGNETELAFRWSGEEPSNFLRGSLNRMKAKSAEVCGNASDLIESGPVVISCIDKENRAGMWIGGRIPRRPPHIDPRIVTLVDKDSDMWNGYWPSEKLNPPVRLPSVPISANQLIARSSESGPYIGWNFAPPFRSQRIKEELGRKAKWSVEQTIQLQSDVIGWSDQKSLPSMLASADEYFSRHPDLLSKCVEQSLSDLRQWDYGYWWYSTSASLFVGWWRNIELSLWGAMIGDHQNYEWPRPYFIVQKISMNSDDSIWDLPATPEVEDKSVIVGTALTKLCSDISSTGEGVLSWGKANKPTFRTFLGKDEISTQGFPSSGSGSTVFAQRRDHGPIWRSVYSLEKKPRFWFIAPGGPSGDPTSGRWKMWFDRWKSREVLEVPYLIETAFSAQ